MKPVQVLLIGGAVADVSVSSMDRSAFDRRSTPVDRIALSTGGDALNEASALAQMGHGVRLATLLGQDPAGEFLLGRCRERGIDCSAVVQEVGVDTSVNVVLVDERGERRFVTAQNSSLRRLSPRHLPPQPAQGVQVASFASLFVSPLFDPAAVAALFRQLKEQRVILCADTTSPKHGERAEDVREALQYVDFFFPNLEEGQALTGEDAPEDIAERLLTLGVKNVVLKLGRRGCYVAYGGHRPCYVPAYPDSRCIDTTGAGDTFVAGYIHGLLWGMFRQQCAAFANAAASICVEHTGCASEALELAEIQRRQEQIMEQFPWWKRWEAKA